MTTLIKEKKNSLSAKSLVEKRFMAASSTRKAAHQTQLSTPGNQ